MQRRFGPFRCRDISREKALSYNPPPMQCSAYVLSHRVAYTRTGGVRPPPITPHPMPPRADGWPAERQVAFVECLRRIGVVGGNDCRCRLQLRKRPRAGSGFVRAWGCALGAARLFAHQLVRGPEYKPRRGARAGRARVDVVTFATLGAVLGGPPAAVRCPLPRGLCARRRCNSVQYACNTARPVPLGPAPGPLLPRRLSPNYGAAPAAPLFCLIRAGGTPPRYWSRRDRARRRRNNRDGNARGCPGRRDRCRPPPAPPCGTRRPARGCRR